MPSVTIFLSHAPQLTLAFEPYFTVTLGPFLLLAALLYDAALIAVAVGVLRHRRGRRASHPGLLTSRAAHGPLSCGSAQQIPGITVLTLPHL